MDEGPIFLGAIFLLVAGYLIIFESSLGAKFFGGGVLAILGILTLMRGIRGK